MVKGKAFGELNESVNLPSKLDGQMISWYRSKVRQTFGRRAQNLTDDQIISLARMEGHGELLSSFESLDDLRRGITAFEEKKRND